MHAALWERMQPMLISKHRLPHAFLFVGPRHAAMFTFATRLIAILLCQNESRPCGLCRECHLLELGTHPDITYIRQEAAGSAIKIEQIRELQQQVYQTPQRGSHRFIVIDPADKMNVFAANALLKILEEPPGHTIFILIAEQVSSIPATILSRCQKYSVASPASSDAREAIDYLTLGAFYKEGSSREQLVKQSDAMMTSLCDVIAEKMSLCTLAAQWSTLIFEDVLWLLYLVTAQAIHDQLNQGEQRLSLFQSLPILKLFKQLDRIIAIMRKINHNIHFNQTLVLEDLLLGYLRSSP